MDSSTARANPIGRLLRRGHLLRSAFEHDGLVIVPQALPRALIQRWRRRAQQMMKHARTITRRDGEFDLVYRVVTGDAIRAHWPELFAFYRDERMIEWVRQVTGSAGVCRSEQLLSAVNLNILDSTKAVYRWHFDAVPYTVLIYLTETRPEDGGALELVPGCTRHEVPDLAVARIVRHFPTSGTIVLMDGTRCYHRVAPMLRPTRRLSIPLVYPDSTAHQRPAGLDSYLYEDAV